MRATTRRAVLFYLKPDDSCELYDDESILSEQPEEESVLWVRLKRFHKLRRRRQKKRLGAGDTSPAVEPAILDVSAPRKPAPNDLSRAARRSACRLSTPMTTARVRTPTATLEASTPAASAECPSDAGPAPAQASTSRSPPRGRRATQIASSTLPPRDGVVASR